MRQGWLFGSLCFALLASGCAKEQEEPVAGWKSFPVEIYTDPALVSANEDREDFYAAMAFWERRAGRSLFLYRGDWAGGSPFSGAPEKPSGINANVIFFQNPWPFDFSTAGVTTSVSSRGGLQGAIIMINPNIAVCNGDCQGDWFRISQQKLFAHELGHFIGMGHSAQVGDIMYTSLAPGGSLESVSVDQASLKSVVR